MHLQTLGNVKVRRRRVQSFDVFTKAEEICAVLTDLFGSIAVHRLFPVGQPDEKLGICVFTALSTVLESPECMKQKGLREHAFQAYALIVKKFDLFVRSSAFIVHALSNTTSEQLPAQFAALVALFAEQYSCPAVVGDLLREVGRVDAAQLNRDTAGARSVAGFLIETSSAAAKHVIPNISTLVNYLDAESYTLRNGVVQALGHLIERAFVPIPEESAGDVELIDGLTPALHETREQLFDILEERVHDINSFTRSKTLQVWVSLVRARCVELRHLGRIVRVGVDRLQDKSSAVRKYAIQLLYTILTFQQIGPNLDLSVFTRQMTERGLALQSDLLRLDAKRRQSQRAEGADAAPDGSDDQGKQQYSIAARDDEVLSKRKLQLDLLMWTVDLLSQLDSAIPSLLALLGSSSNSDVLESIEFFVVAKQFNVQRSDVGLKRMLGLVWSREPAVREAAIDAYRRLYLDIDFEDMNRSLATKAALEVGRALVALTEFATLAELTSLEELIGRLVLNKHIHPSVVEALWDIFQSFRNC